MPIDQNDVVRICNRVSQIFPYPGEVSPFKSSPELSVPGSETLVFFLRFFFQKGLHFPLNIGQPSPFLLKFHCPSLSVSIFLSTKQCPTTPLISGANN
ncbi:hypothetical protein ACFX15_020811 [Malus domestica]